MVVGFVAVVLQTAIFEILGIYLHLFSPSTAVVIGAEFGLLVNFYLNNRFTFNGHGHDSMLVRLLRFHLVVSGSIIIQWLSLFIAEHLTTNLLLIHGAYFAGIFIGFLSNYTGYYLWVWRRSESQQE